MTDDDARDKYFYAVDHNFSTAVNKLPDKFMNRIVCGDSEQVLKEFPDSCVDIVLTSPPYNFGRDYESTDDEVDWDVYFGKLFAILDECVRVLKYGGRLIINIQPVFSHYIPTHHIISNYLMNKKLIWKGEIIWDKHNYNCKYTAWGSWKSCSNPYLKYTWEFLEVFCKGSLKKEGEREFIDINEEEFMELVVAKWNVAPEMQMGKFKHPAMFPKDLVYKALKLFSYRNDIVLDPMNGAGTTTLVAGRLGRNFVGIDISEEYCKSAIKRMAQTDLFGINLED